jgi:hypothetical protein
LKTNPASPAPVVTDSVNEKVSRKDILVSDRVRLLDLDTVRAIRGCTTEGVLASVGDATHPVFLRWVFNMSAHTDGKIRLLRFWIAEVVGTMDPADKWASPAEVIGEILGARQRWARGELERAFLLSAQTISMLIRAGEWHEVNRQVTRQSLERFMERRLQ